MRLVVNQVALLTSGFQVRVTGVSPSPTGATAPRQRGAPLIIEASRTHLRHNTLGRIPPDE